MEEKKKEITDVKSLRDSLVDLYDDVRSGECDIEKGKVMVSASNSILKSVAIELDHMKFTQDKSRYIDFLIYENL